MANLKTKIVVRFKTADGKRCWADANGKTDPQGSSYYLRFYEGSKTKHEAVDGDYHQAELAQIRLDRKLKAASQGFVVPEEPVAEPLKVNHRIQDVIDAYLREEAKPDKNGETRPAKSLRSVRSELEAFATWCKKTYVEELTADLMRQWRDSLHAEKYAPDTIYNKLMQVCSWAKNNPVLPFKLLSVSEFPDKRRTIPDPYTEDEFNAMMAKADYEQGLLLYFFAVTGMREQEIAHVEREDINWDLGELYIVKKPQYGFGGKTPAAIRQVPLPADLLAEFDLRPPGLLFPCPATGRPEGHFLRIIEYLARAAGVRGTAEKAYMKAAGAVKNDWCHRFRDTAITNQLHEAKTMADLLDLCRRIGHKGTEMLTKYYGKLKKPYTPKLRLRKALQVVRIAS